MWILSNFTVLLSWFGSTPFKWIFMFIAFCEKSKLSYEYDYCFTAANKWKQKQWLCPLEIVPWAHVNYLDFLQVYQLEVPENCPLLPF